MTGLAPETMGVLMIVKQCLGLVRLSFIKGNT